MRKYDFENYKHYVDSQLSLTRRKVAKDEKRGRKRCFCVKPAVAAIAHHRQHLSTEFGVCHGVRYGLEVDMFKDLMPFVRFVGTEIVEELCDGVNVINRDFDDIEDWYRSVDLIYSNSFDHSRDPVKTLILWLSCLKSGTSYLYLEWTRWHNKLGRGSNRADCYAATRDEYRALFDEHGRVLDELEIEGKPRVIFVVGTS